MSFDLRLTVIVCASVLSASYIYLLLSSILKYGDIVRAADRSVFPSVHLLRPGFRLMNILGNRTQGAVAKLCEKLGCDDFAAFCSISWMISVLLPSLSLSMFLLALSCNFLLFLCGISVSLLLSLIPVISIRQGKKERRREIERQLPGAISKMVLLTGAGLTVTAAWNIAADSAEGPLYDEMKKTSELMNNGTALYDALQTFASRCETKEARQFAGILSGSMSRGGAGMCAALRYLNTESWEGRRQRAKLDSQAAASALLFPMIVMFIGIVLMIAFPLLEKITI